MGLSVSQAAGKDGMILGSIGNFFKGAAKGIGNFAKSVFSGGSNSSSSGGGGFFGGGSSAPKTSGLDFGSAFKSTSDTGFLGYGQDLSYAQDNFGSFFNTDAFTPKTFSSGFNLFSGKSNYVPGVSETSGMGPLANGTQYAAMVTGNKLFGFDYNQNGSVKGGLGGILKGFSKQGGAIGSLIGGLLGQQGKGNAIGNMFQSIFGGGGSNEDGSANWLM